MMLVHISSRLRYISHFSTLGATTPPLQAPDGQPPKESNNSRGIPDFTSMPPDTSSIHKNSPYYLYNLDPDNMSTNYMKKLTANLYKRALRKERQPGAEKKLHRTESLSQEQEPTLPEQRETRKRKWKYTMLDTNALPNRFAVDLSYSHLMSPLEMKSTAVQLIHLLNLNTTCNTPLQMHVTNFQGCILDHILHLGKKMRPENVHISSSHFTEVFSRDKVVYLSAESDNVLERVDPSFVYIVGGLVDARWNIAGASLQAATDANVRHARLPIKELIVPSISRPLPLNQVFRILLNYIRSNSWLLALTESLDQKKINAIRVRLPLGTHSIRSSNVTDNSN